MDLGMEGDSSYLDFQFSTNVIYNSFSMDEKGKNDVDYEEAMQYTGFGKYNVLIILICGLCLFSAINEATVINFILPSAECDLELNIMKKGILSSIYFIGMVIACSIWGCLADRMGRKKVLIGTSFAAFLCSICASIMPFWGIVVFRFFNGFFMSANSALIFAFLGEYHGATHRPKAIACISCFVSFSIMLLPTIAWLLLPLHIDFDFFFIKFTSWRLFMFVTSLSTLFVTIVLTQISESPKYLYHKGETEKAFKIIKKIYSYNTGWPRSQFPANNLIHKFNNDNDNNDNNDVNDDVNETKTLLNHEKDQLLRMPYVKFILTACLMAFLVNFVVCGLIIWYPDALKRLSLFHNDNSTFCQAISSYFIHIESNKNAGCFDELHDDIFIQNIIVGAAYFAGYVVWYFTVNTIGNRNFFVICMTITSVCLVLVDFTTQRILINCLFAIALALPGIGVSLVSAEILENIPTYYCGIAISMTITASNLGGFISGAIFGILLQWNCDLTFIFYAFALLEYSLRHCTYFMTRVIYLIKMIIKEYRITLPLTVDEYQIAQLYAVAAASKDNTGGGEGIEIIKNEPFDDFPLLNGQYDSGQYTYKIYYLASKVPPFLRLLAPKGSLEIHEEAWNAYPYCRTILTNPAYMKKKFSIIVESLHLGDDGNEPNVHNLPLDLLNKREVDYIDIVNDLISSRDYKEIHDPSKFKSMKTGRGPLIGPNWKENFEPLMTCYKLCTVEFKWFGLQNRIEKFLQKQNRRLYTNFHRQLYCTMDEWYNLTMDDIRTMEDETKLELEQLRKTGSSRGLNAEDND